MSAATRKIPSPEPSVETQPYWDAAKNGTLTIKRCDDCGEPFFYPRSLCPFCDSERTSWVEAKGTGTVYSFSIMRRVSSPYCIAFVTLDEGVAMMTNIVDCDLESVRIGDHVRVTFQASESGQPVPMFTRV